MNELQIETLKEIKRLLPGCHHIDLLIRTGGKDFIFEVDFLKEIILNLPTEITLHLPELKYEIHR
jgi:hypothetical protein